MEQVLDCAHKDCKMQIKRRDFKKHVENECAARLIECEFVKYGCTEKQIKANEMTVHLEKYKFDHISRKFDFITKQMEARIQEQQAQIAQQQQFNLSMKQELADQGNQILALQQKLAEREEYYPTPSLLPYALSMSSQYNAPPNTAEALMSTDVHQGCGTDGVSNSWIQVSFDKVMWVQYMEIAGPGNNMSGGWLVGHLNDRKLQYENGDSNWIDIMMVQNLNQNQIHRIEIGKAAKSMRIHSGDTSYAAIGVWRLFGPNA